MPALLLLAFGLSGCAALLFQTLWFRQAGLAFGNSVWASTLVLASFMGGLALGNGLARGASRSRRPLALYAALELAVAVVGVALVIGLPHLTSFLAPTLAAYRDQPAALNLLRLGVAFVLLLAPTTAMGATLPLLVRAVSSSAGDFGPALGRLYGWNTLGAVAGAVLGELFLVERLGVRGTGLLAGGLNIAAALCALRLSASYAASPAPAPEANLADATPTAPVRRGAAALVLGGAALCGAILLALEVVWFRFLQLFVAGTSLGFAAMLTVVLLGIALGGLLAARWLERSASAHRWAPELAAAAGLTVFATYAAFDRAAARAGGTVVDSFPAAFGLSLVLMLPTCLVSGVLFTFLGRRLRESADDGARAAGSVTLANTVGGMGGAVLAGFVLLPGLGMEQSLFVLGLAYALVAFALLLAASYTPLRLGAVAVVFALAVALFPFGLVTRAYLPRVAARFSGDGSRVHAVREGLTETLIYMRRDLLGEPLSWRMVTNGFSMAGTGASDARYMTLFVHWPMAVRPESKRALLISYGVGVTARALVRQRALETIDVVDISRDVLEGGRIPLPPGEAYPLDDPRVRVHVEDGRFHLLTTDERYDLVTAEPPPPAHAGVVNLYSQEYFGLLRSRLVEGGVVTYWLPVFVLDVPGSRAIVRAFCNVFPDCSLWTGSAFNWMLVGSREARPPDGGRFREQWRDDRLREELEAAGLETAERLGARFLGDSDFLAAYAGDAAPLVDDWPLRIGRGQPDAEAMRFFGSTMDATAARDRFAASPFMERLWPEDLRESTLPHFEEVRLFNDYLFPSRPRTPLEAFSVLQEALAHTDSVSLALTLAGSGTLDSAIARRAEAQGDSGPVVRFLLGVDALARRDYREAEARFRTLTSRPLQPREGQVSRLDALRVLAHCLGQGTKATGQRPAPLAAGPDAPGPWAAFERDCGLWR